MELPSENARTTSWLDRSLIDILPRINVRTLIITIIVILAIFSRFYHVDLRVMSHDETNHVVPSYDLSQGRGYRHDPVTHGPFQFHALTLSYFLLGDNDFSSRVPSVLFSIATVAAVMLLFPRYLGKTGALVAGLLFLISPYMLYYGRYTRNESFVALYGVILLYGILRYLDRGDHKALYLITLATVFHFITKETSFIYTAQMLLFVAFLFIDAITRVPWPTRKSRNSFLLMIVGAILLVLLALGFAIWNSAIKKAGADVVPGLPLPQIFELASIAGALVLGILAIILLVRSLGLMAIRARRSFDMLVLVTTLILPMLAPFPVKILGSALGTNWNPIDYSTLQAMLPTIFFIVLLAIIAVLIGLWWKPRLWLLNFALFYGIFLVFYTTFFTNGFGFITGLVGSLGYWLEQQGVNRGEQPLYYYALIQIPIYEYLAALGTLLAGYFGLRYRRFTTVPGYSPAAQPALPKTDANLLDGEVPEVDVSNPAEVGPVEVHSSVRTIPTLALLLFWSLTALVAYSLAGEKMPWLTVHIALPMLLAAGWGLGFLIDSIPWRKYINRTGLIAAMLIFVLFFALKGLLGSWLGTQAPFQGNTLDQLRATSNFLFSLIGLLLSAGGIVWLLREWPGRQIVRLVSVLFFALLALLTARTAIMASYINYDYATEYLVYAHAAPGPKEVLRQVEEISRRTVGGKDIVVAYDNNNLYPFWWYFRDYPNKRWFAGSPTRDLRDAPLIVAGNETMRQVDSITGSDYIHYDYKRLWWPNQDYYNLTPERIWNAISDPQMRTAVFDIWLNRDYSLYASLKGDENIAKQFTTAGWQPSEDLRFYIRKDVAALIWNYGVAQAAAPTTEEDPYKGKIIELQPAAVIGSAGVPGSAAGQFNSPHGIAFAPDGSLYVADAGNHRIQHLSVDGQVLQVWGSFADITKGDAPGGTFNEPWAVAVAPDGSVFVTDTWNHRVQKFTADGQFVSMWGYFGQAEQPEAFWGPRDLAVDQQGRVYVVDTGNKRVVIFDQDGNYLSSFGSEGFDPGQFSEPMGIALDAENRVYIADTWNQRVQVFNNDNLDIVPVTQWDVYGWFGKALTNYPFVTVDSQQHVFVSDPEGYRILEFTGEGEFVRGWGGYSSSTDGLGLPSGLAIDPEGHLWVSDAGNNVLLRFDVASIP